jgi:branched-chain amino acid transport system permease protein
MNVVPFLIAGLGVGAAYSLAGVGLVVLYRASATVNFAFGAIAAVAANCAWSVAGGGWSAWIVAAASVAAGTFLAALYGVIVAPRLAQRDSIIRSVGTLGFALVLLGLSSWYWGEGPRRLVLPSDSLFVTVVGVRVNFSRLISLGLAAAMVGAMLALLRFSRLGLRMRALADNRELSAILGVRVIAVDTLAWLICGAFAGTSGLLLANLVRLQPTFLTFLVIPAIAAALLGRLSSLALTAVAGIAIGVLESALTIVPVLGQYRASTPFFVALVFVAVFGAQRERPA